jgi:hypothetical protein
MSHQQSEVHAFGNSRRNSSLWFIMQNSGKIVDAGSLRKLARQCALAWDWVYRGITDGINREVTSMWSAQSWVQTRPKWHFQN